MRMILPSRFPHKTHFMKWWQKYLSYLTEIHIESAPSEYNPHLYVCLRNGRYQLCTDAAVYSYADKYDNFVTAFQEVDLDRLPGNRVLILGFGLGSIPYMLEHKFGRRYEYTGVEIDEEVLYLATKYALPDLQSPLELVRADALLFLEMREERYDLICVDIFEDSTVPEKFETPEFFALLRERLQPGGLILYNRLSTSIDHVKRNRRLLDRAMRPHFPEATLIETRNNHILTNRPPRFG